MKAWIDISSPPHVNFFSEFIKKLGERVIVTARDFATTKDSLDRLNIEYKLIGSHGRSKKDKLIKSSERIKDLAGYISNEKPDVGISKHSVECPRVCHGLDIPNITILDHDPADIQNRLMVPLADVVITPEFVSKGYLKGIGAKKIVQFHGVCESVNLDSEASEEVLNEIGIEISNDDPIIMARSEPFLSSHLFHKSNLFEILKKIQEFDDMQIVFFPRNNGDREKFSRLDLIIPEGEVDTLSLYKFANLMIGAGCCMNREAGLSGCPTISVYPDELPSVDQFLIKAGLMKHTTDVKEAIEWTLDCIENNKIEREKIKDIIKGFEDPHKIILETINEIVR